MSTTPATRDCPQQRSFALGGAPVISDVFRDIVRPLRDAMHVNTLCCQELRRAELSAVFATLDWKTRERFFTTLYALAGRALIEEDSIPERARQEISQFTGSPLLGDAAAGIIRRWAAKNMA